MRATTPLSTKPGLHYAWVVAFAGASAMICGLGLARFAFGMMLPSMSTSLGLTYGQGGVLGFANMVGYLVAVLLAPIILPRLGTRLTVTFSLLLIALSMFGMALTQSFATLCALYIITGIGSGGVVLPSMSVMSHWFLPSHRGLAAGLVMSGPGFGIILSGFVVPRLVPTFGLQSWQVGWIIFAAISTAIAMLAFVLLRNHPLQKAQEPFGRAQDHSTLRDALTGRAKLRLLMSMGLIFAIYGAVYMLYVTFIVTSMVDAYGLDPTAAGTVWSSFGFLSIFSGVLFGIISDRLGRRRGLAMAFAVLSLSFLLVGIGTDVAALYISILLFGLAAWSIPVIMAASAGDFFGTAGAANALAALTFAFSGGQAAGPVIAGFLAECSGDFSASYAISGIAASLAIAMSLRLKTPDQGS
ncbi:YbfB/YjiJ family MFS transporter [Sulfitobacter pontiacus]|jgi:MFS family permease|uniref:YbfB/YjiJ family MFS transporter n=1 Tax=Sulfitobacter pontiacus TaxID=60137 RepID=UPI002E179E95|tara:strand:+ start:1096 stop:2334 length:1239 start_codon:yes stop_codon:yes gene_type:complete